MKAVVVYDSVFGNTEKIALAIGSALGSKEDVSTIQVKQVKQEQVTGVNIIVVGSPTRAFRHTEAIGSFIKNIPSNGLAGVKVAAFDTRISVEDTNSGFLRFVMKLFGYAAKPIADKLRKKGGSLIIPPEGFIVNDSEGPLKEGELERATEWAGKILNTEYIQL